jgi:heme exporter protein B
VNSITALILKDFTVELRRKETVASMAMFGLLVMVVFSFAFEPTGNDQIDNLVAPGVLWVALTFAGMIGLNRTLAIDLDNDALQGLLLAPIGRGALYVGKVLSNFLFMLLSDIVVLILFVVFNNLPLDSTLLWIVLVVMLGTFGFAGVGTILSMISSNTRMHEVMLPVLQIPLTLPLLMSALGATALILDGEREGLSLFLNLVIAFDIIFFVISYLVFEYVVEE